MDFNDCDCFMLPTATPSVGLIFFGGLNPQHGQFLSVNGNTSSLTNSNTTPGSTFVVGAPMRIFAATCNRATTAQTMFMVVRNGVDSELIQMFDQTDKFVNVNMTVGVNERLQLRANVHGAWRPAGPCLITLMFTPLSEQLPLYYPIESDPENVTGVNLITFGGQNVLTNASFMVFNGNVNSLTNTDRTRAGNVFIVGSPTTIFRLTWHKSTSQITGFRFWINGRVVGNFTLREPSGVMNLNQTLSQGDTFQLMYQDFGRNASPPGNCLVTFYTRP
jgi:hypothetical protein